MTGAGKYYHHVPQYLLQKYPAATLVWGLIGEHKKPGLAGKCVIKWASSVTWLELSNNVKTGDTG